MIKVGVVGSAGYTAGELIRILMNHSDVEIAFVQSESHAGNSIQEVHKDLIGEMDLVFNKEIDAKSADVIFLCKGHGESTRIIEKYPGLLGCKIIDLSQDFRLEGNHNFVYGLPEKNKSKIIGANWIANPGCFATCIQLGIIPAINEGFANGNISVSGITGSSGAGQKPTSTSHFSWRSNNASVYKALTHQHMLETNQTIESLNPKFDSKVLFVPYRGAFTRGIITTAHFETDVNESQLIDCYEEFYADAPFTHVVDENPDLKWIVNTNKCLVYPRVIDGTAIIVSVIDNMLKGASGQAVQNMNLLFGLDEKTGLHLKPSAF